MNEADSNCDGNCDYSSKCYTYSVKQKINRKCLDIPSYIILSTKDNCNSEMDKYDYVKLLDTLFDTNSGKEIEYEIIYGNDMDELSLVNGIKIPINYSDYSYSNKNERYYTFTICLYGIDEFVTANIGYGFESSIDQMYDYGYSCISTFLPDICEYDTLWSTIFYYFKTKNINISIIFVILTINIIICCICFKRKNKSYYDPIKQIDQDIINEEQIQDDHQVMMYQ